MFALKIGIGTMSEYDTFMFTYTIRAPKAVFLEDRVTVMGLELCVDQRPQTPKEASTPMLGSQACATVAGFELFLVSFGSPRD